MSDQPGEPSDEKATAGRGEISDEEAEQLEKEREERLDPANRPDNAEVDNSDRDFDPEVGKFTDSDGYEEAERRFGEAASDDDEDDEVVDTDEAAETSQTEVE